MIYADLIRRLGEGAAQLYAGANQAALERIAGWVAERALDCAFERRPAYGSTQAPDRVGRVEAEFERRPSSACRRRCECHGSTFEPDGSVIHGPAVAPLAPHGGSGR